MCGIAGLLSVRQLLPAAEARDRLLRQMARVQAHRGPDDEGVWHDPAGRCSLAHRRLSIIDPSQAGHQPMLDAAGRWVVSFNGEIYNFNEVRAELEAAGVAFRGRTDTEVLLQAVATWGAGALPRLDGMFAFAAFDRLSGQLILARDPFGEKPLYYVELQDHGLAFASELQALELVPGVDRTVSADAVAELLMFQYIGAPRTIYGRIKKLPQGHSLAASPGEAPKLQRYFQFSPGEQGLDRRPIAQLADELEDILARSLRRRLIADVPLGAFLSGGVDSSTVCALIRRKLGVPLKTYSIGFAGAPESEHETARLFARHLGTEHHERIVAPQASEFLYGIGRLLDEPNADSSCLPTYLLSAFARESVTVALSGDGGDEMFGGYGRYHRTVEEGEGSEYYSNRILVSTEEHIVELFGGVPPAAREHLRRLRESLRNPATPLLCRLRKTDVDNYLPGAVLAKVDRMSMRHSLEVRTPFLNVELARFAERLPPGVLYAERRGKPILRELAYRYLPRELVDLPKQGFGLPMTRWARDELLEVAARLLETEASRLRQSLGAEAIARFMQRQRSRDGFVTYQLWALAMLESWLRHHDAKLPSFRMGALVGIAIGKKAYAVVATQSQGRSAEEWDAIAGQLGVAAWQIGAVDVVADGLDPGLPGELTEVALSADQIAAGCKLIVPPGEAAALLEPGLLEAWRLAGVGEVVAPHPHAPGSFLRFKFNRDRGWKRLVAWWGLRRRAKAAWWGFSARESHGGRLRQAGPFRQLEGPQETELACRYAAFRGARQLIPLPSSHEEVARASGERYSVWSRHCLFKAAGSWPQLQRYWLVEKTATTRDLLPVVVDVIEPGVEARGDFFEALRHKISGQAAAPQLALRPGDGVVVFTHSLQPGGAERQWCYLALGLKQRGFHVHFVVEDLREGEPSHYRPLLERHGIVPVEIARQASAKALAAIPRDPDSLRLLRPHAGPFDLRLLNLAARLVELRPKAVFAQLDGVNVKAGVAAIVAEVPRCVLSFRNYNPSHFSYLRNDWFLPCYQALAQSPRIVLAGNSTSANADYAAWLGMATERIALIPNCIDAEDFQPGERRSAGTPVILGVFRLSEEKDPRTFLQVCARVAGKVAGLRVLIAGVGPLQEEMKASIQALGLENTVMLLGRRTDIAGLMAGASLLLLSSTHEGMPNVVMEAQLSGLPVVATRAGGTADIVLDGVTGYVRAVGDVAGLTEACVALLGSAQLQERMGMAGRNRMSGKFSKSAMVDGYINAQPSCVAGVRLSSPRRDLAARKA